MEYSFKSTTIFIFFFFLNSLIDILWYNVICNERVLAEYEMSRFFEKIQGPKVTIVLKFSTIKFIYEKVDYH